MVRRTNRCKRGKKNRPNNTRQRSAKTELRGSSSSLSASIFAEYLITSSSEICSLNLEDWTPSKCSWDCLPYFEQFEDMSKHSSYFQSWLFDSQMSFSCEPESTQSSDRPSPNYSASKLTVKMFTSLGTLTESVPVIVNKQTNPFQDIDGLSVWTIKSLTSSDQFSEPSTGDYGQMIHVKYPWSPATFSDVTTEYPSSVSSFQYVGSSEETVHTSSSGSTDTKPYSGLDKKSYYDLIWVVIARSKILFETISMCRF